MWQRFCFVVVIAGALCWDCSVSQAATGVRGKTYNVLVKQSQGPDFLDVWAFKGVNNFEAGDGTLKGGFVQLTVSAVTFFQAVADDGEGYSVQFIGIAFQSQLVAIGSNSDGVAYKAFGTEASPN